MATASYSFEPGQTVWCIVSSPPFVQAAVVAKVTIQAVLPSVAPTVQYQVQYTGTPVSGSSVLSESHVFGDVDSALTAYRQLITAP